MIAKKSLALVLLMTVAVLVGLILGGQVSTVGLASGSSDADNMMGYWPLSYGSWWLFFEDEDNRQQGNTYACDEGWRNWFFAGVERPDGFMSNDYTYSMHFVKTANCGYWNPEDEAAQYNTHWYVNVQESEWRKSYQSVGETRFHRDDTNYTAIACTNRDIEYKDLDGLDYCLTAPYTISMRMDTGFHETTTYGPYLVLSPYIRFQEPVTSTFDYCKVGNEQQAQSFKPGCSTCSGYPNGYSVELFSEFDGTNDTVPVFCLENPGAPINCEQAGDVEACCRDWAADNVIIWEFWEGLDPDQYDGHDPWNHERWYLARDIGPIRIVKVAYDDNSGHFDEPYPEFCDPQDSSAGSQIMSNLELKDYHHGDDDSFDKFVAITCP